MSKAKRSAQRIVSFLLAVLTVIPVLLMSTGCSSNAKNVFVNAAIAGTLLDPQSGAITAMYAEQQTQLLLLKTEGIITDQLYGTLSNAAKESYERVAATVGQALTLTVKSDGTVVSSDGTVVNTDGTVAQVSQVESTSVTSKIEAIDTAIKATQWLSNFEGSTHYICPADGCGGENHKCDVENCTTCHSSNCIVGYSSHDLRKYIVGSDYNSGRGDLGALKKCWEVWGSDGEPLQQIVDSFNAMRDITIRSLTMANVDDVNRDYSQITAALRQASSSGDTSELNSKWFTNVVVTNYTPENMMTKISVGDIYIDKPFTIPGCGAAVCQGAIFHYKGLDVTKMIAALEETLSVENSPLQYGVLIGNTFYITKYDVAVLDGFRERPSKEETYAPMFVYGHIKSDGDRETSMKYSYTEVTPSVGATAGSEVETYAADTPFNLTERVQIDFSTGTLIRKGGVAGESHEFMGIGSESQLPAVIAVPKNSFKRVTDGGSDTVYISPSYYDTADADSGNDVVYGISFEGHSYEQPLFILCDYLETVYSPGILATEPLVAYGRKLRLSNDLYTSQPVKVTGAIGYIVGHGVSAQVWDNKGQLPAVSLRDLIDIDGIYDRDSANTPPDLLKTDKSASPENAISATRIVEGSTAGTVMSGDPAADRGDRLPQIVAKKGLDCVVRFGSPLMDYADDIDGDLTTRQTPMYAILLYGGLYDRGLFTNWINASGNSNMEKWGEIAKTLGYPNYMIDGAVLNEQMRGNYAFELNQDGILSMDMDVVLEINEEAIDSRRGSGVMALRTVLLVLGFVLIAYVSLLLACYALDVNLDLGFNLTQKVTFGHFIAVRSLDEMPEPDPESSTSYVDYRGMIVRCIIFAIVGVLLITIDPVDLVIKTLSGLNFLLNEISKLIFGTSLL